ncbi:Septin [Spraguea lophii 42_110]|uniref:Septin n=1 Tax=Spraguea lophii (strain 42_110) TaxID=1358809 RepID=S7WA12_SPRLO|nr:Septin [Spraguea lophii 42_110]
MESDGIGIPNLPNQKYSASVNEGIKYNIMIAGGNGIGKTSLMNFLLNNEIIEKDQFDSSEISYMEMEKDGEKIVGEFKGINKIFKMEEKEEILDKRVFEESEVIFQITEIEINERRFNVNLTVTEIDNIGDGVNNNGVFNSIVNFINYKYKKYYENEKQTVNEDSMDERIHVCMYLFEPVGNKIKPIDIKIMKKLSKICNIIPVIPKQDGYTELEKEILKTEMNIILKETKVIKNNDWLSEYFFPFFVGTGESVGIKHRNYAWGTANPIDDDYSDSIKLKNLIIKKNLIDLVETTEKFYENYKCYELAKIVIEDLKSSNKEKERCASFINDFIGDQHTEN